MRREGEVQLHHCPNPMLFSISLIFEIQFPFSLSLILSKTSSENWISWYVILVKTGASGVIAEEAGLKSLNIDPIASLSGKATKAIEGVMQQTYESAEVCLDTNCYGCKRVTEALIPLLKLSTSGARIANVSSVTSELKGIKNEQTRNELGNITTLTEEKVDDIVKNFLHDSKHGKLEENGWPMTVPAYSISKMALNAYTRVLAKKYPNMYINCVHLGYVNTDMNWHTGTMTVEEGVKGPVMLALLPNGGVSGCYFDQTEMRNSDLLPETVVLL